MNKNYEYMQQFLDIIKEFSISNPTNEITANFVYSNLIRFRINENSGWYDSIDDNFYYWKQRFYKKENISVFETDRLRGFCFFTNGDMKGNEVKLYIPLKKDYVKDGVNQLFDFISSTNIEHQSKIATIVRNDNVVVRVNNLEDAKLIIEYVTSNEYIKAGMLEVNPFLPSCNGVGITMDNNFSFNSELSKAIASFIEYLKSNNYLHLVTLENFNNYINNNISKIENLELKDIYCLLAKTTSRNFSLHDFVNHANNKLIDRYTDDRKRIIDPNYYLENAIIITERFHAGNSKTAIKEYMHSNARYFTNKERAREGLMKYVTPGDLVPLMRVKIQEKGITIPEKDEELIEKYLDIVLNKQNNYCEQFEIIKQAYMSTLSAYDMDQALTAFRELFLNNGVKYFTNRFGDRERLIKNVLPYNVKKIIISNIDTMNLDINNIDDIFKRFLESVNKEINKTNVY